jgi:hypothetical protein
MPKQHVFSVKDPVAKAQGARLDVALQIVQFKDSRRSGPYHDILFLGTNEPKIDGKRHCVNGEKWYEEGAVAREVSQAVAHYVHKRGRVKVVGANAPERPLFSLRGNIQALYGVQEYHWGSAIGAGFGLIGAAATANNKSLGQVYIELKDLTLVDEAGREVSRLAPVVVNFEGELPIDANCVKTYVNVREHFTRAAELVAASVEQELEKLTAQPAQPAWPAQPAQPAQPAWPAQPDAPVAPVPTSGSEVPAPPAPPAAPAPASEAGSSPASAGATESPVAP